jgi:2C-methyl-D-erythritol 2,4-cyclodiphosphate synthase
MPCLTVQTNIADHQITDDFLKQLSATVAQAVGKPEQYIAVQVSGGQKLFFAGTNEPAAVMELVSIGLSSNQTSNISKQIMSFFEEKLHIKTERIYIKFTNIPGNMMGWNKGTF